MPDYRTWQADRRAREIRTARLLILVALLVTVLLISTGPASG